MTDFNDLPDQALDFAYGEAVRKHEAAMIELMGCTQLLEKINNERITRWYDVLKQLHEVRK